jgi:hypothetical protein
VDSTHPPRHVELGPVVLRHPDPSGTTPPPDPPGRLLAWAAGASAGLIMLVGVSVVYVLAATTGAAAPTATPTPTPTASAAPTAEDSFGPGHCPATVRAVDGPGERPPADPLIGVTVCRYHFPPGGAGTLVGAPVEGRPESFLRAVRGYRARPACRPASPHATTVVDVVHLVYDGAATTVWLPRLPCAVAPADGDPATGLLAAVDGLLGPPR